MKHAVVAGGRMFPEGFLLPDVVCEESAPCPTGGCSKPSRTPPGSWPSRTERPGRLAHLPDDYIPDGLFRRGGRPRLHRDALVAGHLRLPSRRLPALVIEPDDCAACTNCGVPGLTTLWATGVGREHRTSEAGGRLWRIEIDAQGFSREGAAL